MDPIKTNLALRQRAACGTLQFLPIEWLAPLTGRRLIIPYYHMISDQNVLHVRNLYPYKGERQFRRDVEFLLNHFRPVSISDVMEYAAGIRSLPGRSFLLTFDDGFREMAEIVAPILLQMGAPAVFFLGSAFVDNRQLCYDHKKSLILEHLKRSISPRVRAEIKRRIGSVDILSIDWEHSAVLDQIAEVLSIDFDEYLKKNSPYLSSQAIRKLIHSGFGIGAHSVDHPLYSSLPLDEQLRQTEESVRFVRETYDLGYGAFAFPHGDDGVGSAFFSTIYSGGLVDVTFGTGGLVHDALRRNFQRVSFEKPLLEGEMVLRLAAARKMYRTFLGRGTIRRE